MRDGSHMTAINLEEAEEHVCLNCGTTFRGDYCPRCRQRASTQRLNLKDSANSVISRTFGWDRGLLHTLVNLFYRPAYMIRDYLNGYRVEYIEPLMLLIILIAIDYLFPGNDNTHSEFPESWSELQGVYPISYSLLSFWYWVWTDLQRSIMFFCIMVSPALTGTLKILKLKDQAFNLSESLHVLLYLVCYFAMLIIIEDVLQLIFPSIEDYEFTIGLIMIGAMYLVFLMTIRICTDIKWYKLVIFAFLFPIIALVIILLVMLAIVLVLNLELPDAVNDNIDLVFQ